MVKQHFILVRVVVDLMKTVRKAGIHTGLEKTQNFYQYYKNL